MVGVQLVREKRDQLAGLLAAQFTRWEPVQQAGKYIDGLMSELPDKNCWSLAQLAGDASAGKMQRLLERAAWDQNAAMRTVRDFAVEHLAGPDGLTVLVLNESGQVKQGEHTAGVKPQYVGCAGRVTNAINFVNATCSTARGHTLIASRLWVPGQHLTGPATRDMMGIPGDLQPATKPQLGAQMLAEALDAGIEAGWAAAGEVYGQDPELRKLCEERGVGYVFGVACSFLVTVPSGARMRADKALIEGPQADLDDHLVRGWVQRRAPLRLRLDRRQRPPPPPADPPQPARPCPRRLLLVFRARRPPGLPADPRCGLRPQMARRRRPRIRQGPVRLRPRPGPLVHPDHAAPDTGHGRPGHLRSHRRPPARNQPRAAHPDASRRATPR